MLRWSYHVMSCHVMSRLVLRCAGSRLPCQWTTTCPWCCAGRRPRTTVRFQPSPLSCFYTCKLVCFSSGRHYNMHTFTKIHMSDLTAPNLSTGPWCFVERYTDTTHGQIVIHMHANVQNQICAKATNLLLGVPSHVRALIEKHMTYDAY